MHLLDSQTALGAFIKHRSPSSSIHYLMQRASAIELAADFRPILGYCRSHRNPSDLPSRRFLNLQPKKQKLSRMARSLKHRKKTVLPALRLCDVERCLQPAPQKCDNCRRFVCLEHRQPKAGRATFCTECRGFHVRVGSTSGGKPPAFEPSKRSRKNQDGYAAAEGGRS